MFIVRFVINIHSVIFKMSTPKMNSTRKLPQKLFFSKKKWKKVVLCCSSQVDRYQQKHNCLRRKKSMAQSRMDDLNSRRKTQSHIHILMELYLQYTEIKTLPENMLHTPKHLKILDLSGNIAFDKIPDTFTQARSLEDLYLNNTGFINLTQENGFPEIPSLKVLHLCRNQHLNHIDKHSLSNLKGLQELRLSDNIDLISIHPMALAQPMNNSGGAVWPPIKKLYIGNNKLAYLDSDILARWDDLIELDIKENPWTCECENQWLIDVLMPIYLQIDIDRAKEVMCAAPVEMKTFSFYAIYVKKSHMRCLDLYGARPERDGPMLVGILAGILIAIPALLFILYAYHRKWFSVLGICDNSPASYSRRFYSASATDDNF